MSIRQSTIRLIIATIVLATAAMPAGAANHFINGRIAFTSIRDGNSEIYVMNPNGSGQTRLTFNKAEDLDPAWSPDATRIAFVRDGQILIISPDGSTEKVLTDPAHHRRPSWSPDGKLIAFDSTRDKAGVARDIFIMKADGTNQTRITTGGDDESNSAPAWSPDGRSIAFACGEKDADGNGGICVMDPDGFGIQALTANLRGRDIDPAWSPDGRKIVFERSGEVLRRDVMIMNADGSDVQKIANGTNDVLTSQAHPVFSPDGKRIAFGSDPGFGDNTNIRTMDPDGSNQIALTQNPIDFPTPTDGLADDDPSWGRKFLPETTGVYVPSTGEWLLRDSNTTGGADFIVKFGGRPGDLPVAGDWNGDGRTDIAVFRDGLFVRALLKPSCFFCQPVLVADPLDVIVFGEAGDLPVAGDWNGDGVDDLGVFRAPKLGTFLLRVPLGEETFTTQTVPFSSAGNLPVAGDWNNDGKDEIGTYNPTLAEFSLTEDFAEPTFIFPFGLAGDRPLVGDWLGLSVDGVGVFDPVNKRMLLGTGLTLPPNIIFKFGVTEGLPVAGHWSGTE